jgi:hypothetical protein
MDSALKAPNLSTPGDPQAEPATRVEVREANNLIGAGVGIGAFGAATAAAFGAVCPVCVVATPLLIGAGVVKRVRAKRRQRGGG